MEEHKLFIVEGINKFLNWFLSLFIQIEKGREIIPAHIIMALLTTLLIIIFFKLTVKNLSLFPSRIQTFLEVIFKFFRNLIDEAVGEEGRQYLPVIATLGIFIAISNLWGLLPGMGSPTADLNVTVGCALFTWTYYHVQGMKKHGFFKYLKSFAGPVWYLSWLFFPIEIISHLSRPVSLSLRLFGNIFGEDLVILSIASLLAYIAPLPMMAFAIFTSFLQAYIFVMLSLIYLAGAMASEH